MKTKRLFLGMMVAVTILMSACSGLVKGKGEAIDLVLSYDQLFKVLENKDMTVQHGGNVTQPFFEPEGQVIVVEGQDVQVFEFNTEAAAASAASSISPDGSSIGTSMVSWVADPHFYHAGRLVVIYLGSDGSVISALEDVLGSQIAGK